MESIQSPNTQENLTYPNPSIHFDTFDPRIHHHDRNTGEPSAIAMEARKHNEALVEQAHQKGALILGVEVSDPALAEYCDINIDPQHTDGKPNKAAIEIALEAHHFSAGDKEIVFVTDNPDMGSIATMSVLSLVTIRHLGITISQSCSRLFGFYRPTSPIKKPESSV